MLMHRDSARPGRCGRSVKRAASCRGDATGSSRWPCKPCCSARRRASAHRWHGRVQPWHAPWHRVGAPAGHWHATSAAASARVRRHAGLGARNARPRGPRPDATRGPAARWRGCRAHAANRSARPTAAQRWPPVAPARFRPGQGFGEDRQDAACRRRVGVSAWQRCPKVPGRWRSTCRQSPPG